MNKSRRKFVSTIGKGAFTLSIVTSLWVWIKKDLKAGMRHLRPPGALPEEDFITKCIRCGLCVRDCPFDILKLATIDDATTLGTPFFIARTKPCEMCEDIPCVKACPSDALMKSLTNINDSKMGLAVLVDQENCLNHQGLRCDICFNVCPIPNEAITLKMSHNKRTQKHALFIPTVHSNSCTGCGKCEKSCPLPEAAIKILPLEIAKGKSHKHYRLGWEEQKKAGKPLVTPDQEHRYNLPKGVEYLHNQGGLKNWKK